MLEISPFLNATVLLFSYLPVNQKTKSMKKILLLSLLATALLTTSCNSTDDENDPINCTQEFVSGLHVTVLDNTTGQPLVEGVTATAVDGTYTETLELVTGLENLFIGAGERVGNYTITVTKSGYQTYTSSPITVTRDVCHVITQSLTVNLRSN